MWVTLNNGAMVNMNHASKVRRRKGRGYVVFDVDGEEVGETDHDRFEDFLEEVVPAAANQEVVILTKYEEDGVQVQVERRSVVGWRLSTIGAYPVIAGDELASNQTYLIPTPDGAFDEPFIATWKTLEDAIAYLLKDRAQAPTP